MNNRDKWLQTWATEKQELEIGTIQDDFTKFRIEQCNLRIYAIDFLLNDWKYKKYIYVNLKWFDVLKLLHAGKSNSLIIENSIRHAITSPVTGQVQRLNLPWNKERKYLICEIYIQLSALDIFAEVPNFLHSYIVNNLWPLYTTVYNIPHTETQQINSSTTTDVPTSSR
jgi:hypothetical protein